ncbi:MAG: hypothetical protein R2724_09570 [Bryobacterales bacterium]
MERHQALGQIGHSEPVGIQDRFGQRAPVAIAGELDCVAAALAHGGIQGRK